jgi:purine-binding chemotaxis protein CheW
VDNRVVALFVESVVGIRELSGTAYEALPPLLHNSNADLIEAVGTMDSHLLIVLRVSRLAEEDIWKEMERREAGQNEAVAGPSGSRTI